MDRSFELSNSDIARMRDDSLHFANKVYIAEQSIGFKQVAMQCEMLLKLDAIAELLGRMPVFLKKD